MMKLLYWVCSARELHTGTVTTVRNVILPFWQGRHFHVLGVQVNVTFH